MAFATGWPEGSSPISVSYADAYFADRGVNDWAGTDPAKEVALTRATDYVKALFLARFDPAYFTDVDLNPVVPVALQKAVAEYALIELKTPGGLAPPPVVDPSGYNVIKIREKVGPIEEGFAVPSWHGSKPSPRRSYPVPDALIASILLPSLGLTRATR